jgi:hypothetical protein
MGSTPFFIPDTSPLFAYDPCVDCASSSSWVAAYSSAVDGFDQTFHQTNVSESSVAFNISGKKCQTGAV